MVVSLLVAAVPTEHRTHITFFFGHFFKCFVTLCVHIHWGVVDL